MSAKDPNQDKGFNTSKGRKFVVVSFWGRETTVDFFDDANEAERQYDKDDENGADVLLARVKWLQKAEEK